MATIDTQHVRPNNSTFPKPPAPGTLGARKSVISNYVEVVKYPSDVIYQYDVVISPSRGAFKRLPPPEYLRSIFDDAMRKYRQTLLKGIPMVYNDRSIAYAPRPVCAAGETLELEVSVARGGGKMSTFIVKIKQTVELDMGVVKKFVDGTGEADIMQVQAPLTALDAVFGAVAKTQMVGFGRSFFSRDQSMQIMGGLELWRGFSFSVRPGEGRLFLNVNTIVTAMYTPGPLLDALMNITETRRPDDLAREMGGRHMANIRTYLQGLDVQIRHRGLQGGGSRKFSVKGMTPNPLSEEEFDWAKDPDRPDDTVRISVARYYKERYNISLRYPHLPGLVGRNRAVYPIEMCEVEENQRYKRKLNEKQTADMVRFACQRPSDNQSRINGALGSLDFNHSPVVREFGIAISTRLSEVESRVLPTPTLLYGKSSREPQITPRGGAWNMRDKQVYQSGRPLSSWGVLVLANERFAGRSQVQNFVRALVNSAKTMNFRIDYSQPPIMYGNPRGSIAEDMARLCQDVERTCRAAPQMVLVILSSTNSTTYQLVKNSAYTALGVQTQCMQSKHIARASPQYCANLVLKINAKFGGMNQTLPPAEFQAMMRKKKTLFLGCDVSHPGVGEARLGKPSIASVVGSVDLMATKYVATLVQLPMRQELVEALEQIVRKHLIMFYKHTNVKPARLVFYRDGASETQFADVRDREILEIQRACASIEKGYKPEITFIAVLKRHHTRFFPTGRDGDRTGNCVPGTVVDRTVTMPAMFDFFMYPHAAIQGTSRPTHYYVLHDDSNSTADEVQQLTYSLCYTYAICTRSVSIVPPVYYAHRVADRARCHYVDMAMDDGDEGAYGGRGDGDEDKASEPEMPKPPVKIINIHDSLDKTMYFM